MAFKVNRNIDWLTDALGALVGYKKPNSSEEVYIPVLSANQSQLLKPDGSPLLISGGMEIAGLVSGDTSVAARNSNRAILLSALATQRKISITTPGEYSFAVGTSPYANFFIPSDTTIYLGAGVQLTRPRTNTGAFFMNENALSSRIKVSSIAAQSASVVGGLYPKWATSDALKYVLVTTSGPHGLVAGNYAMLKDCGFWNGIWDVLEVPSPNTFYFMFSGQSKPDADLLADYSRSHCWKADANIQLLGEGIINSAYGGGNPAHGFNEVGVCMNKVKHFKTTVSVTHCVKYAYWTMNMWYPEYSQARDMVSSSDGLHMTGPQVSPRVLGWQGGSSGDDGCILSNDSGSIGGIGTRWFMYDADGGDAITNITNNGSGAMRVQAPGHRMVNGDRVQCEGSVGSANALDRSFLVTVIDENTFDLVGSTFDSNATGGIAYRYNAGGDISNAIVERMCTRNYTDKRVFLWGSHGNKISATVRDTGNGHTQFDAGSLVSANKTHTLQMMVPNGQSATFDVVVENMRLDAGDESVVTIRTDPVAGVATPATFNIERLHINNLTLKKCAAFPNGHRKALINLESVIGGFPNQNVPYANIQLSNLDLDFDASVAGSVLAVVRAGATSLKTSINGMKTKITGVAATLNVVSCTGAVGTADVQLNNFDIDGSCTLANFAQSAGSGVSTLTVGSGIMTGAAGGGSQILTTASGTAGPSFITANLGSLICRGSGWNGLFSIPATGKGAAINISGIDASGINGAYSIGSGSYIQYEGSTKVRINSLATAAVPAGSIRAGCDLSSIDADKLSTTFGNHAKGVLVYNTNATPVAGVVAMGITGVGTYVADSSGFVKV